MRIPKDDAYSDTVIPGLSNDRSGFGGFDRQRFKPMKNTAVGTKNFNKLEKKSFILSKLVNVADKKN